MIDLSTDCSPENIARDELIRGACLVLRDDPSFVERAYEGQSDGMKSFVDSMVGFVSSGCQVFDVGPSLFECFRHMSLRGVMTGMLVAPYKTFYVSLPVNPAQQQGGLGLSGIAGFYVTRTSEYWHMLVRRGEQLAFVTLYDEFWDHFGGDLESFIDSDPDLFYGSEHFSHDEAKSILRTLAHLLLYLSSESPEILTEEPRKLRRLTKKLEEATTDRERRKVQRKLDRITPIRRTKLAPSLESSSAEISRSSASDRHWVRGHWKRQRYGEGRRLTKIIQVWPYLRGEGDDPKGSRTYRLREDAALTSETPPNQ